LEFVFLIDPFEIYCVCGPHATNTLRVFSSALLAEFFSLLFIWCFVGFYGAASLRFINFSVEKFFPPPRFQASYPPSFQASHLHSFMALPLLPLAIFCQYLIIKMRPS
jgi:hypothetical protein